MRNLAASVPARRVGDVDLRAEPDRWLPEGSRRAGPTRWWVPLRLGPVARTVACDVGTSFTRHKVLWRPVSWAATSERGDPIPVERLLPTFEGHIGLRRHPPAVVLRGTYTTPLGPIGEAVDRLVLHRAARHAATRLVEEIEARLGASRTRPVALIVDEDPDLCLVLGETLRTDGYRVVTCPGPAAVWCPAAHPGVRPPERCSRVAVGIDVVLLGTRPARAGLADTYTAWLPRAQIRRVA